MDGVLRLENDARRHRSNMPLRLAHRRYRLPFRAPVRTTHGVWTEREGVIVRLEDEPGGVGWGEAAPLPEFGTESAAEIEAVLASLHGVMEPAQAAALPPRLVCVRSALAAALAGLARSAPAGAASGGIPAYLPVAALLPAGPAALAHVRAKGDAGFRSFKWKVGAGDPADEIALLDDLCAVLPAGAKLRLDANGAWDRRRAELWLERCAERPVEYVEQPIAPEARGADDLLLGLAADYPTPIALDESLTGAEAIDRWLEAGWPGLFVVKPSLLGDPVAPLLRLQKSAADRVVFSSALETAVGAQAALRIAFAWRGKAFALGFGVWPLFADSRFDGPAAGPFIRVEDVERLNGEAVWNALN
jgi:O-succinylbenzoate synthase